jgi:PAS domain S-box-containing protein
MVKSGEIIGKPFFKVFPDTTETFKKTGDSDIARSFRRVIETGKPDTMPPLRYDIKDKKGKFVTRYWQVAHYPVFDNKKQLIAIFQDTRDITEEVVSENRLERTQQQLEEVLASGLIGTWSWNLETNTVVGDKIMAKLFGLSESDAATGIPPSKFTAAVHPDDRPRIRDEVAKLTKKGSAFKSEYRTLREDGTYRWVLARGRIKRDKKGKAILFPGVLLDITDRKTIENNLSYLAKAGAVLSASLDYKKTLQSVAKLAVPDIADWCSIEMLSDEGELETVAVAHKDPKKVAWARKLQKEQGPRSLNEPTGVPKVLRTGEYEFYPVITEEMLVAAAKSKEQLKIIREVGFTSVIIVPIVVNNVPVGAISLISSEQKRHYNQSDLEMAQELAARASIAMSNASLYKDAQRELAARRKLEEELRIANEELERRVLVRTAQLEQTNLSLQRSNQELQDFAYVASHDLQEPLRKIQAFGNLLEDEYGNKLGDGKDYLDRMRSAAARMSALIEDILSFSRVTTKARGFTSVDLNVVAVEVLEDLETRIQDTNATIQLSKLPTIDADAMQIRQVLQNLISNALKFHKPNAAPTVKISASTDISQEERKKYCTLTIEDNGVGFDEKYLDRIFAVFQRLHSRDSYEGTGIGLAVCRKIIERHGGTITAKSTPNSGAKFIIRLPVHHKKGETL